MFIAFVLFAALIGISQSQPPKVEPLPEKCVCEVRPIETKETK